MEIALSVKKITKKFGDFTAVNNVSFDVEDGKFFSILGPSGCGKTTLLRMIAGFCVPNSGVIMIRGKNMVGVEPNRRPVNLIFQNLALFPMMDVKENIAFGLKRRGERGKQVYKKVVSMLERVGLSGYENYKIDQLSGGQKQRVAIARSLVLEPSVLLLDEPLGALDLKLREHMKIELKELQHKVGTTFVYVTHDQSEAMVMSDYVAVMNQGQFEQIDTPQNLYYNPRSSFVAQFVGENNKFTGKLIKNGSGLFYVLLENGLKVRTSRGEDLEPEERVEMFIRPESLIINPKPEEKDFNIIDMEVKEVMFEGGNSRILGTVQGLANEVMVELSQDKKFSDIKVKDRIKVGWDPSSSVCFKDTGVKMYDEL